MSWNVKYVFLILFTTAASYFAAILIEKNDNRLYRKLVLTATLISCLGVLAVFKYYNFIFEILNDVVGVFAIQLHHTTLSLLLPVGISFYTFQTLSYVIDVYRGNIKAEHHFGLYATFISFFPQLVAGPIERASNLLPQIKAYHTFNYNQTIYGSKLIIWGLFKKMAVADNLSPYVDRVYENVLQFQGFAFILATIFFAFQIYCDFSGYSDIARGTAKLMGIELMENFKSPYFSASIREFWSRWHISLSTWFRDYVYIPLGGNRRGKYKHYLNLLITFTVSGLWHGANWTFIIWGALHGFAHIFEKAFGLNIATRKHSFLWLIRVCLVFIFVTFAWIFFRAQTLSDAMFVISHIFTGIKNPFLWAFHGFSDLDMKAITFVIYLGLLIIPLTLYDYVAVRNNMDTTEVLGNKNALYQWVFYITIGLILVFFTPKGVAAEFIYFQF